MFNNFEQDFLLDLAICLASGSQPLTAFSIRDSLFRSLVSEATNKLRFLGANACRAQKTDIAMREACSSGLFASPSYRESRAA